jgi:hypothetical protein
MPYLSLVLAGTPSDSRSKGSEREASVAQPGFVGAALRVQADREYPNGAELLTQEQYELAAQLATTTLSSPTLNTGVRGRIP